MNAILLTVCISMAVPGFQPPPGPPMPIVNPVTGNVEPIIGNPPSATSGPIQQLPSNAIPVSPVMNVPEKIPTLEQFQKTFVPVPGVHDVTVIHPVSKKPINVLFRLPEGQVKTHHSKRILTFDYGKKEVRIIFRIGGRVDVRYE